MRRRNLLLKIFFILAVLLVIRIVFVVFDTQYFLLDPFVNKKIQFEGVVILEPQESSGKQRLVIKPDFLEEVTDYSGNIQASTGLFPPFTYGDRVIVSGKLTKPENRENAESGRVFDYVSYLALNEVYYLVPSAQVTLLQSQEGSVVKEWLFSIRRKFLDKVNGLFPQPHGALVGGLLIGAKELLGKELQEDFRRAGIIHIVVLSGFNITIIAKAIMAVLSFLPRKVSFAAGMSSIILFAIMTGASATVVRSSIMAVIALFAGFIRRDYDVVRALAVAALLMILADPRIVFHDPSFQLSFLATVGLIYVSAFVKPRLYWITEKFQMREICSATISTQIFVLPYLLYAMGEISLVALLVNVLVLPAIPLTMLFSFLAAALGFIHVYLAFPFVFISYLLLEYELGLVGFFSNLSFAAAKVQFFPLWLVWACYAAYLLIFWRHFWRPSKSSVFKQNVSA